MLLNSSLPRFIIKFLLVFSVIVYIIYFTTFNIHYTNFITGLGEKLFGSLCKNCAVRIDNPETGSNLSNIVLLWFGDKQKIKAYEASNGTITVPPTALIVNKYNLNVRRYALLFVGTLAGLILATPLSWINLIKTFVISQFLLHFYLFIKLGITVLNTVKNFGNYELISMGNLGDSILNSLDKAFISLWVNFIIVFCLWIWLSLNKQDVQLLYEKINSISRSKTE